MSKKTKYPIYIISKGRWEKPYTASSLDLMNTDYKIVVEPKEYDKYAEKIHKDKILVAPENFSELNQGSIPVRNWLWQRSIENGDKRHWILDDNIMTQRACEMMGGKLYKKYRVYETKVTMTQENADQLIEGLKETFKGKVEEK